MWACRLVSRGKGVPGASVRVPSSSVSRARARAHPGAEYRRLGDLLGRILPDDDAVAGAREQPFLGVQLVGVEGKRDRHDGDAGHDPGRAQHAHSEARCAAMQAQHQHSADQGDLRGGMVREKDCGHSGADERHPQHHATADTVRQLVGGQHGRPKQQYQRRRMAIEEGGESSRRRRRRTWRHSRSGCQSGIAFIKRRKPAWSVSISMQITAPTMT